MVIALPRLQTATTKRCENASASVKLNYRSLPVGPRVVRMIDVSTYEGADFMGDRLRHVGSAVPRTSGLAEPKENNQNILISVIFKQMISHYHTIKQPQNS